MQPSRENSTETVDPRSVLPVVVGAHLQAERTDRPIADALAAALESRLGPASPISPLVVTDLWYLNDEALRAQPTVSVGRPELNAQSAYLADKLPSVLAADDRLVVQMDLELIEPVASCWGVDGLATAEAVQRFLESHAGRFLEAAISDLETA